MAIDTKRLIQEVQKRSPLWDLRDPLYKNREVKQKLWKEITKILIHDFKNLTPEDRDRSIRTVHQRWKSCRDQYVRYKTGEKFKRPVSGVKNKKKYVFANLISFLDPVTNIQNFKVSLRRRTTNPNEPHTSSENATFEKIKRNCQEMTTFEKELLGMWKSSTEVAFDEDIAFFNSVLSAVRRLSFEKKFLFRSQVLQLLMQLSLQNNDQTLTSTIPLHSEENVQPHLSSIPNISPAPIVLSSFTLTPANPSTSSACNLSAAREECLGVKSSREQEKEGCEEIVETKMEIICDEQ